MHQQIISLDCSLFCVITDREMRPWMLTRLNDRQTSDSGHMTGGLEHAFSSTVMAREK